MFDAELSRHRREIARAVANHKYEVSENGIFLPGQKAFIGGVFETEHRRSELTRRRAFAARYSHLPIVGRHCRNYLRKNPGVLLDRSISPNIIPTEGLNHALDAILHGGTQVSPWYVALFKGTGTPSAGLTAANFASTLTEFTGYSEANRVVYNEGAAAGGVTDNDANRAEFTINATDTVYGGALLSVATKSSTSGVILCAAKFAAARAVVSGDTLQVKYALTLTST